MIEFENMRADCTVLVIAPAFPKYSEAWMVRMTKMLRPDVRFVALSSAEGSAIEGVDSTSLIDKNLAGISGRLRRFMRKKSINDKLVDIANEMGEQTVILCHYMTLAVFLSDALSRIKNPVFVHCHGHDITWNRKSEALTFLPAHGIGYVRKVKELRSRITPIANSIATRSKLVAIGFSPDRVPVKYLGVDVPDAPSEKDRNTDSEKNILFLGRLTDFKGPVETIQAFTKVYERGMVATLLIAGGGHQKQACEQARHESSARERIRLLGPVGWQQAMELMGQAILFTAHNKRSALTGQEEAFGVSVVEAMAAGLPVVTGRSGGVCETVVHEETGILFTPGDIDAHADALYKLCACEDERRRLGVAAHQRAKQYFSTECETRRLKEILFRSKHASVEAAQQDV